MPAIKAASKAGRLQGEILNAASGVNSLFGALRHEQLGALAFAKPSVRVGELGHDVGRRLGAQRLRAGR